MSTRTTYTSSMVIPATIRWKCSKCGSINTASSSVGVAKQVTKTGLSTGNAAEENKKALEAEWMEKMLEIMTDPGNNASQFRSGVYKKNCKCAHCSKKEFWARDQWYLRFIGFLIPLGLVTGGCAFSIKTSVGAWLAFLACIGAFIYCFVEEESYKTKLGDLSSDLLPTFITDNQDLIDYANEKGYNISSFEGHVDESSQAERKVIGNEPLKTIEDNPDQKTYCHKCGKKLKPDSDFCSYCGADLRQ